MSVEILEYRDRAGHSPFREWFDRLNFDAARKVTTALFRLSVGNFSTAKTVGKGVHECRINFGPGYRVYFGIDGEQIVILLAGGTKKRQSSDIQTASERWQDYKQRRHTEQERWTKWL